MERVSDETLSYMIEEERSFWLHGKPTLKSLVYEELQAYRATCLTPDGIQAIITDVTELNMNDSVVMQSMAELARYADIGIAPNQIVELLSIAMSLIRDSEPFESDKIFIHINRLKKLLGSVE